MKRALNLGALLLGCLLITDAQVQAQVGAPTDPEKIAQRYAAAVLTLDRQLPADSAQIYSVAKDAAQQWSAEVPNFQVSKSRPALPATILAADSRLVASHELLDLVDSLGDISNRLTAAKYWMQMSVATEQIKVSDAKAQAKARNLAEIQRAYKDYHVAVQARQGMLWELSALASGRKKVVVVRSSALGSSFERDATPAEARAFAANLYYQANAPFNIVPPQTVRPRDIHPVTELLALKEDQLGLETLRGLIDCELNNLKSLHSAALLKKLAEQDLNTRKYALASAGWWNDAAVKQAVFQALEADDVEIREAAFASLRRMRMDASGIARLLKSGRDEVRMEAARLASEWIHDPRAALTAIKPLLIDSQGGVRAEAYAALTRIAPLAVPRKLDPASLTGQALASREPSLIIDACRWLESYGGGNDQRFNESTQKLLVQLTHFPNPDVKAAAQAAAQGGIAFR